MTLPDLPPLRPTPCRRQVCPRNGLANSKALRSQWLWPIQQDHSRTPTMPLPMAQFSPVVRAGIDWSDPA